MAHCYEHPRPALTADVVAFAPRIERGRGRLDVLLVRRGQAPFRGRWALPGGFVEIDEELENAARRELLEETGVGIERLAQVGAFGAIGRDPRGRTVSVAFVGVVPGARPEPEGADDADEAAWHDTERMPRLAFDHRDIVRAARDALRRAIAADGTLADLLPARVATGELHALHEAVVGRSFDPAALRRRLLNAGCVRSDGRGRLRVLRRKR